MMQPFYFIFLKYKKLYQKSLVLGSGRNFKGRICVQHQGSADKHNYIKVDRFRNINFYGFILRIIDVFYVSAFLGLVLYENGLINFILLSEGVVKYAIIFSGTRWNSNNFVGSTQKLMNIKLFDAINSIEKFPRSGAKMARAAGSFAKIISKNNFKVVLKFNSGWQLKVSNKSLASLGIASNLSFIFLNIRKAGVNRSRGIRPTVRGVIKNPCDHPHGGGEGKGSPPVAQVSPWGWLCKGTPTKNKKKDRINRRLFRRI